MTGIQLPVDVPIWMAAEGPVGYAVAAKVGDGVITGSAPQPGTGSPLCDAPLRDKVMVLMVGTVLDHDESLDSPRVLAAAGPCAALLLHLGSSGPLAGTAELDGHLAALRHVFSAMVEQFLRSRFDINSSITYPMVVVEPNGH